MKTAAIIIITAALFALCLPLFAAQFPDVPTDHWAYAAVQDLADKGVVIGYPDGTFSGKRALTRYEFAEALARAIPMISKLAGGAGAAGEVGPAGAQGPAGITPEELANIKRLIDEFKAELAAQGVDIQALKKDVAALDARLKVVEAEQARVKITADAFMAFRGAIQNSGDAVDRDGRYLALGSDPKPNALEENNVFNQINLKIKGKVSKAATVTALISAGNYLPFALGESSELIGAQYFGGSGQFDLYYLYLNSAVNLGPLGKADATVGRFPFQLTPLTFKFIAPDSYIYDPKLQTGDYPLDGGNVTFKLGKTNISAFAGDTRMDLGIVQPVGIFTGDHTHGYAQLAGARAVIGAGANTNIGLTYLQLGMDSGSYGQNQVFGADVKTSFSNIGLSGEWAESNPSDMMNAYEGGDTDTDNQAWYANMKYNLGKLSIGGGYSDIGMNYSAPGNWNRAGQACDLTNVKGWNVNMSYPIAPKFQLWADGQFLEPKDYDFAGFRWAAFDGGYNTSGNLDKINAWKAGVKYALTAGNSVDLGMEEVQWSPIGGSLTRERYYNIGLGHTFSSHASLKLLYQIVDYKVGSIDPYDEGSFRGGITSAQFLVKY